MITSTVIEVLRHASSRWAWSSIQAIPEHIRGLPDKRGVVSGFCPFSCLLAHRFNEQNINTIQKQPYFAHCERKFFITDENSHANAADSLCGTPITAIARQMLSFLLFGLGLCAANTWRWLAFAYWARTVTHNFPAHSNIQMSIYCQLRLIGSAGDVAQHLIVLQSSIGNNSL